MNILNNENINPVKVEDDHRDDLVDVTHDSYQSVGDTKKARKVFGDLLVEEDAEMNSLSYSPSPVVNRFNQICDEANRKVAPRAFTFEKCEQDVQPSNGKTASPAVSPLKNPKQLMRLRSLQDIDETKCMVNKKSDSVTDSLNIPRKSKKNVLKKTQEKCAKFRMEKRSEKEEANLLNDETERVRRELIELKKQQLACFSRAKVARERAAKQAQDEATRAEIEFKSQVYRDHKKRIKEEQERKRRMSTNIKAKMRSQSKAGQERMKMARIEEDMMYYEERHSSSIAIEQERRNQAERRRRSLMFRNGAAKKIRQIHKDMVAQERAAEHASYELKWAAEKDAEEYKLELEQKRRQSLAGRNEHGKKHREIERNLEIKKCQDEHESFELKWAGENDVNEYKSQMEEKRRISLAGRNAAGKEQREAENDHQKMLQHEEHESYELKWQGEKDALEYKKALEEKRRQSLAYRNMEGKQQRIIESDVRAKLDMEEHLSYELKWAGEKDVEKYRKEMEEERRRSLALRNEAGKEQRKLENEMLRKSQDEEHESYLLKWTGEKDAEDYKKKMQEERRLSLAYRNEEGRRQRAVMEELLALSRQKETESLVLKWAAENDAKKYLADEEEKRRQSLAFRNLEGKRHRQLDAQMQMDIIAAREIETQLQSECQKDVENYEKECQAKVRADLLVRKETARLQRLEDEDRRDYEKKIEEANRQLEAQARGDVQEYVEQCKARRRLSLAWRAKEKSRHVKIEKEMAENERLQRNRYTRDKALDEKYAQLARDKERMRHALDALRHNKCTFASNPFASLL